MFRIWILIAMVGLIAMVALAGNASADIIDISFPELTGDYETGWLPPDIVPVSRSTTFMFPPDVESFEGLRLVLSGAWTEGVVVCSNAIGPPDTTSFTPGLSMILKAPQAFDGFFYSTVEPPNGSFSQWSATFEFCCPPGSQVPVLLLGEVVSAELFCDHMLILPCSVIVDSYGEVTEVRLEAHGAVPLEGSSWGGLKSLFR